jgi:hypothetical protein
MTCGKRYFRESMIVVHSKKKGPSHVMIEKLILAFKLLAQIRRAAWARYGREIKRQDKIN